MATRSKARTKGEASAASAAAALEEESLEAEVEGGALAAAPLSLPAASVGSLSSHMRGVVKVYTYSAKPNFSQPWQTKQQQKATASGFIIAGRRILTNAHAVAYHTSVQVRKHGSAEKVTARVAAIAHDCDVAILTVDDESFWEGSVALDMSPLVPHLRDTCVVVGFPLGGDQICITAGVVSRLDYGVYSHSTREHLVLQVDSAINPGNSGGPVFSEVEDAAAPGGRRFVVIGIAFQSLDQAEAVGYVIPTPVVAHVMADYARTGRAQNFGRLGFFHQTMENVALRRALRVPAGTTGIVVTRTAPTSAVAALLRPLDVVTHVKGAAVADDGTVVFRGDERINFCHLLTDTHLGEPVPLRLLRGGVALEVACPLEDVPDLVPRTLYERRPSYIVFAGLVFTPLSEPYLSSQYTREWESRAPVRLVHLAWHGTVQRRGQQVVLLTQILASEATVGYDPDELCGLPLVAVNGAAINSLADLAAVLAEGGGGGGGGAGAASGGKSSRRRRSSAATGHGASAPSSSSSASSSSAAAAEVEEEGAGSLEAAAAADAGPSLLRFEFAEGKVIYLPRAAGLAATQEVCRQHAIPAAISDDLLPPGAAAAAGAGTSATASAAGASAGATAAADSVGGVASNSSSAGVYVGSKRKHAAASSKR